MNREFIALSTVSHYSYKEAKKVNAAGVGGK